jgi:hypothetical protein
MQEEVIAVIGTATYILIKFVAYSYYAKYLNYLYKKHENIWKVGVTKVVIGLAIGAALYVALGLGLKLTAIWYFIELTAFRILEWTFIVWLFYDRSLNLFDKLLKASVLGMLVSAAVDLIYLPLAFFGLIFTVGGIC